MFAVLLGKNLYCQSLFESSCSKNKNNASLYQLNGYIRTDAFVNETDYRSVSSELSLKLETTQSEYGKGFAEIRIQQYLLDREDPKLILREAYADLFLGKTDVRIGQQVIVWGRADGFNPTNNLTPHEYGVFSPEEDDSRMSNFVVSGTYNAYPWRVNFNWIPIYRASKLPIDKTSTSNITWINDQFPEQELCNSNMAIKISYEAAAIDGSISYFRGYHKTAGVQGRISNQENWILFQCAHFTQVWGADFSTSIGNWGLRGEFAYSLPENKTGKDFYIPEDQIEYTIGLDREWGDFSIIGQYIGKHVIGFEKHLPLLDNALEVMLYNQNNLLFSQTNQWLHSISVRPSASMIHETFELEILSLYNITTEEVYMKPMAEYSLSDNIALSVGAQLYYGPDNSLFDKLEDKVNALFVECKINF